MLAERLEATGATVWLLNTGWTGGAYGVGSRIKLGLTRAMLAAIHSGELQRAQFAPSPVFNLAVPAAVRGVPDGVLQPRAAWGEGRAGEFDRTLAALAARFADNFRTYEADGHGYVAADVVRRIKGGGPAL